MLLTLKYSLKIRNFGIISDISENLDNFTDILYWVF